MNAQEFKSKLIEIVNTVNVVEHEFDEGLYKLEMHVRVYPDNSVENLGVYIGKGTPKPIEQNA